MSTYSKADGITSLKNNVMYSSSGSIVFKQFLHYQSVAEAALEGKDGNVFADPMWKDAASGDFSFKAGSPARSRGIRPLSFAGAGCTGGFASIFERFYRLHP